MNAPFADVGGIGDDEGVGDSGGWPLRAATDAELAVLAECWSVPVESLLDRGRAWLQAIGEGDAAGPRVVDLAERRIAVLPPPGQVAHRWAPRLIGMRGLIDLGTATPRPARRVRSLDLADGPAVDRLHAQATADDLRAASPHVKDSVLAVGQWSGGELISIAALVTTPAGPPEVSILVHPDHRGRGVACATERVLVGAAAARRQWRWLQHRTVIADVASQRLAAACGFRLLAIEHLTRTADPTSPPTPATHE